MRFALALAGPGRYRRAMATPPPLEPLDPADWDPSLAHVLEDMRGAPINVHRLMAHNPALLAAWWNFRNHSVRGGALGQRRGELVILRVAVHLRSWYEWASHVDRALAVGLTMEEIERVKAGGEADGWAPAEAALLAAVDELVADRSLSAATLARLGAHFETAEIMDIIAIHGMYVILGCMIATWGLALDPATAARLPDGVTRDAFEADVGRG